ncbi:hypothetical protein HA402_011916 [Bradysia odoriphaga]|nr:hypothetical protein HA402_011916 [Bradysia odoriphaga]
MNLIKNCVRDFLLAVCLVTICSADNVDDGFLNVTCNEAQDCYVLDDVNQGLWLACWYNVQKCKCQNTISSDFNLKWDSGKCLMSKYGPCGAKGELAVGCQDGCSLDDLELRCNYDSEQCECAKVYIADAADTYWDIKSYDGNKNCSVGKFGPCGSKNGIVIDCHGDGITCVNGRCLDPNHLTSDVGEECADKRNCKEGLLCSQSSVCIEPFSLPEEKLCGTDEECQKGLQCKRLHGPWSSAFCTRTTSENESE